MTDTPDREALSPIQRRAHADLHAAVTATLAGDPLLARSLLAQNRQPRALVDAAVTELASAIETLAQALGGDPQETWTQICQQWHTTIDP